MNTRAGWIRRLAPALLVVAVQLVAGWQVPAGDGRSGPGGGRVARVPDSVPPCLDPAEARALVALSEAASALTGRLALEGTAGARTRAARDAAGQIDVLSRRAGRYENGPALARLLEALSDRLHAYAAGERGAARSLPALSARNAELRTWYETNTCHIEEEPRDESF